jgi:hypothetical protein
VIVDDFNIAVFAVVPSKADAPLVVYSDAPLAHASAFEGFQTVSGWIAQIVQRKRVTKLAQLAQGAILNSSRKFSAVLTVLYSLGLLAFEGPDPCQSAAGVDPARSWWQNSV